MPNNYVDHILVNGETNDIHDARSFSNVAFSGDYTGLINKPTIPTKTSDLTNDSGFITNSALTDYATKSELEEVEEEIPSLDGYATESWVEDQGYVTEVDLSAYQKTLIAGTNISIAADGRTISATGGASYTAGDNITIENNVISATDTTYTAGTNITIDSNNVISATGGGTEYTAGQDIVIDEDNVISTIYGENDGDHFEEIWNCPVMLEEGHAEFTQGGVPFDQITRNIFGIFHESADEHPVFLTYDDTDGNTWTNEDEGWRIHQEGGPDGPLWTFDIDNVEDGYYGFGFGDMVSGFSIKAQYIPVDGETIHVENGVLVASGGGGDIPMGQDMTRNQFGQIETIYGGGESWNEDVFIDARPEFIEGVANFTQLGVQVPDQAQGVIFECNEGFGGVPIDERTVDGSKIRFTTGSGMYVEVDTSTSDITVDTTAEWNIEGEANFRLLIPVSVSMPIYAQFIPFNQTQMEFGPNNTFQINENWLADFIRDIIGG